MILKGIAQEILNMTKELLKKRHLIQGYVLRLHSIALRPQSYAQKKNIIIEEIEVERNTKTSGWYKRVQDLEEQKEQMEVCELLFSVSTGESCGLKFDEYVD